MLLAALLGTALAVCPPLSFRWALLLSGVFGGALGQGWTQELQSPGFDWLGGYGYRLVPWSSQSLFGAFSLLACGSRFALAPGLARCLGTIVGPHPLLLALPLGPFLIRGRVAPRSPLAGSPLRRTTAPSPSGTQTASHRAMGRVRQRERGIGIGLSARPQRTPRLVQANCGPASSTSTPRIITSLPWTGASRTWTATPPRW